MDATRRVKALGYGEQRIEALGQQPYLDYELKDGSTVRMPHPLRLDDDALTRLEAYYRGDGLDREPVLDDGKPVLDDERRPRTRVVQPPQIDGQPAPASMVRLMRAVLGDDAYDALAAHGITARELHRDWQSLAESAAPGSEDGLDPKGKRSSRS